MEQHLKLACFLAFLLLVLCCFMRGAAHGSPLDCESVKDADQRNACRAVARNDRSFCEFIKDRDLRSLCRARVR